MIVPVAFSFKVTAKPTATTSPAFTSTFHTILFNSLLYVPFPYIVPSINVVCSGITSDIVNPVISSFPLFFTAIAYVKASPAATELFPSVVLDTLTISKSGL